MDENLINKTLKIMNTQTIDETLLDELQAKVCLREKILIGILFEFCRFLKFSLRINIMGILKQHRNI